jgi:hypothetical protein
MSNYLERDNPPTCLHAIGQLLIEIWEEGQKLKKRLEKYEGGKLYAVVSELSMNGDSFFYCPTSRVEYTNGMVLAEIKEAYIQQLMKLNNEDREDAEYEAENLEIAWILNEHMVSILEMSAPECGNDSQVYSVNRTMKEIANNLAIKIIKK